MLSGISAIVISLQNFVKVGVYNRKLKNQI